ncbi:MAG TPA: hypothetical protein VLA56_14015, partial [Pseudomonadales bacterium]|nr:hypothetical protein [Pseudomonadales bacterium]
MAAVAVYRAQRATARGSRHRAGTGRGGLPGGRWRRGRLRPMAPRTRVDSFELDHTAVRAPYVRLAARY